MRPQLVFVVRAVVSVVSYLSRIDLCRAAFELNEMLEKGELTGEDAAMAKMVLAAHDFVHEAGDIRNNVVSSDKMVH